MLPTCAVTVKHFNSYGGGGGGINKRKKITEKKQELAGSSFRLIKWSVTLVCCAVGFGTRDKMTYPNACAI